jgi:hypothetical protein
VNADFKIIFDEPTREDLMHCDFWCMFYNPDEIDELEKWGVPRHVLNKRLVDPLSVSNDHPIYPIPQGQELAPREYIYLKLTAECEELGPGTFDGFATLVDGDLRSVNIFYSSESHTFLLYPIDVMINVESFKAVTHTRPLNPTITIRINASRDISWAPMPSQVEIPFTDEEE